MKIDNINTFDIFNGVNNKEIELFLKQINHKSFKKNKIIMKEGDVGGSMLFLLSGQINITKSLTLSTNKNNTHDNSEKEFIRCKASDKIIIGEISLFSQDNIRTATVKALSECEIGYLDNKDFFKICDNNVEVGYKVLKNLVEIVTKKLINTNHQVLKLTTAFSLIMES